MFREVIGARRRAPAAVATSLVVHAAIALWLWRHGAQRPFTPAEPPVEITIESRPAPAETPAAPPAAEPVAAPERRPVTRRIRREPTRPAPAAPAAPSQPPATASSEPAPAHDLMRMRGAGENLSLDWGTFQSLEGNGPAAPPAGGGHRTRERGAGGTTAERVAEMLRPSGEDNVRAGKVHPQFYDYLRDAKARFHPTLATVEKDAGAPKVTGFFKAWWQDYLSDLAARGAREGHETTEPEKGAVELVCDVCLTVRFGDTPELHVARGSSSRDLDDEALAALRHAVDARPITEPLVPAGARPTEGGVRACYRFSASARRLPPTAIGCGFDEVKMKAGCVWPLKKIFRSDVKLLSAEPG